MARKKNIRNILLIGGIAYLAYIIITRSISKISYGTPTIKIWGIKGTDVEFRVFLPVINESSLSVTITGFLGQVFYGNDALGTVTLVNPVQIPSLQQTTIEFRLVANLIGTALEVVNVLTDGNPLNWKNANYHNVDWSKMRITGTLKAGALSVNVNTKLLA